MTLTCNDNYTFTFTLKNDDGTPYTLSDGDKMLFSIFKKDVDDPIYTVNSVSLNAANQYEMYIKAPNDGINDGDKYIYSLKFLSNGAVKTVASDVVVFRTI